MIRIDEKVSIAAEGTCEMVKLIIEEMRKPESISMTSAQYRKEEIVQGFLLFCEKCNFFVSF